MIWEFKYSKMADYGKLDVDYLQKENRKLRIELK